MARVTVAESKEIVNRSRGIRMFKFEPGSIYHVLFLGEKIGEVEHPIMYMNPTHNVRKDGGGFEARCANKDINVRPEDVILLDENGELMLDPLSGRPINDGTCPYCELNKLYADNAFAKRDKYIADNPSATEKEIKEFTSELFRESPITDASQARVMLVAIFEMDDKNKIKTDSEGNKMYTIMGMKFSEHRFSTKLLEAVEINLMGIEDENNDGIAWNEYYFKFPKADGDKKLSGKDLTVSPVNSPVLGSDPSLKEKLEEEIANLDLDALEDMMYVYKLKSIEEMERDIAPLKSLITEDMTEEQIEKAKEQVGKDEGVTEEEIESIMGESKETKKEEDKSEEKKDEDLSGENAFNPENLEEVENLM